MKRKTVYLDMDGTIADLYGIENWLQRLQSSDETIFKEAKPIIEEELLYELFPSSLYDIKILSMTPKDCSKEYAENVKKQKDFWLDKFFPSLKNRIYKEYSYNKNLKNSKNAILIDDNEKIRDNFKGMALDPMALWG